MNLKIEMADAIHLRNVLAQILGTNRQELGDDDYELVQKVKAAIDLSIIEFDAPARAVREDVPFYCALCRETRMSCPHRDLSPYESW